MLPVWGGVLAAAAAGLGFALTAPGVLGAGGGAVALDVIGWNALYCLLLGVIEETVFCGGVLPALMRLFDRRRAKGAEAVSGAGAARLRAAASCALLFGAAHAFTGYQLGYGWFGVALKCLQAALFGFAMATLWLTADRLKLLRPIAAHSAFDFVYLGVPNILAGVTPLAVGAGVPEAMPSVVASGAVLLATAVYGWWLLARAATLTPPT